MIKQNLFLWGNLFTMLCVLTLVMTAFLSAQTPDNVRLTSALQGVFVFAFPAFVTSIIAGGSKPMEWLGLTKSPSWKVWLIALGAYLVALPVLEWTVNLNNSVQLPEAFSALEVKMRAMQAQAQDTANLMLDQQGTWPLILNILVVGLLTGFCEEIFFRGAFQKILLKSWSPLAAILFAAFIFSVLHFDFYGLLPRFLLGAGLGYAYYRTGSLWVPVAIHSLNNILVIFGV